MKIRKAHDSRDRVQLNFLNKGRTKQAHKEECDINTIMRKYEKTGLIGHVNKHAGNYGDVSGDVDYQEALNIVQRAKETFQSLPSAIRARFENDPGQFLEYAENPDNVDGMREMGLLPPLNPPGEKSKVEPAVKAEPAKPEKSPPAVEEPQN